MLTLIQHIYETYTFIDIETYKLYSYRESEVTNILKNSNNKVILNGVKLVGTGEYTYIDKNYSVSPFNIYILCKIDNIGYIVSDSNGNVKKIDNATSMAYAEYYKIGNASIVGDTLDIISYYGTVKASDIGISNIDGLTVQSKMYTGKRIDWAETIPSYNVYRSKYIMSNGKLVEERTTEMATGYELESRRDKHAFALCRAFDRRGIRYKVYDPNGYGNRVISLETIYENHSTYLNVRVIGSIIRIVSLDGIYEYDMDLVYKTYNTTRVASKTAMKASVIGMDYKESIDMEGRLHRLANDHEMLAVPSMTKHIMIKSIHLQKTNSVLVFPKSVETCAVSCFDIIHPLVQIEHVKIEAIGDGRLQILRALNSSMYLMKKGMVIEFIGDVGPAEFGYLAMSDLVLEKKCQLRGSNREGITDNFIESVVNSIVAMRYNNFSLIASPIEPRLIMSHGRIMDAKPSTQYNRLKKDFKLFKQVYKDLLAPSASDLLNQKVEMFMGKVESTFKIRDEELNDTIRNVIRL